MRKIIKAVVLTLVLAIPALAGEIGNPVALQGEIGNPIAYSTITTMTGNIGCPLTGTEVAISLLQAMLALF